MVVSLVLLFFKLILGKARFLAPFGARRNQFKIQVAILKFRQYHYQWWIPWWKIEDSKRCRETTSNNFPKDTLGQELQSRTRFGSRQTAEKKHALEIWRTTNRKKKKHALEHDLVHDKPPKKNASEHDLVHDKPPKKARIGARFGARQTAKKKRIGARFGARQTAKKSTHRSTIWCTTNRKEKHALEHDLVEKKNNIILAPAQQQTWQTNRWSLMRSLDNVWLMMINVWYFHGLIPVMVVIPKPRWFWEVIPMSS